MVRSELDQWVEPEGLSLGGSWGSGVESMN